MREAGAQMKPEDGPPFPRFTRGISGRRAAGHDFRDRSGLAMSVHPTHLKKKLGRWAVDADTGPCKDPRAVEKHESPP